MRYAIHTLDMWGHVPADCKDHGCPCMRPDLENADPDNATDAPRVHDDNACQCSEDCNQQFRRGTLTVPEGATDESILTALGDEGFSFPVGSVVDDYSDGPLDVNDAEGRRLLHLTPIEPMQFRIPLVWRRTARYHERLRPHVHEDGRLESCGDGGYPLYYVVQYGDAKHRPMSTEIRCPKCATDLHEQFMPGDVAQVTAVDVNWEDPDMMCDCGERIESAYAECDDCDNGPRQTPGRYHEPCSDPECPDEHLATCVTCKGHGGKVEPETESERHDRETEPDTSGRFTEH